MQAGKMLRRLLQQPFEHSVTRIGKKIGNYARECSIRLQIDSRLGATILFAFLCLRMARFARRQLLK
jgi:hypothetical protein